MDIIPLEVESYSRHISTPESPALQKLNRDTHAMILRPRMLSGHLQGKLLEMISLMIKPRRVLEIGTYTGYSAICLAKGLDKQGIVHTIDHNQELEDFTRTYINMAGLSGKIIQHLGEAIDIIPTIDDVFDLVFIDADKENYINYLDLVLPKTRKGGIILADNVLWSGKVVEATKSQLSSPARPDDKKPEMHDAALRTDDAIGTKPTDPETTALMQFNEYVKNHPGIDNLLLPFRDGLMICVKK